MTTHSKTIYGQELIVAIHNVNMKMNDINKLKAFAKQLVLAIGMKLGPIHTWPSNEKTERKDEDEEKYEDSRGISVCQFLCESSLTIHFIDEEHKCFINLFSCRPFVSARAMQLIRAAMGGTVVQERTIQRP